MPANYVLNCHHPFSHLNPKMSIIWNLRTNKGVSVIVAYLQVTEILHVGIKNSIISGII